MNAKHLPRKSIILEFERGKGGSSSCEEKIDFDLLSSSLGALLFTFSWWLGELLKCYSKTNS